MLVKSQTQHTTENVIILGYCTFREWKTTKKLQKEKQIISGILKTDSAKPRVFLIF